MKYFFIPGRLQDLAYAELYSVCTVFFENSVFALRVYSQKCIILDVDCSEEKIVALFGRLGGFTRCGNLIANQDEFLQQFSDRKNLVFGVSYIGEDRFNAREIAEMIKESLQSLGVKSRFVLPESAKSKDKNELNAASITKNKIIEEGFELVVIEGDPLTGSTLAVQDVDDYTKRDYGRPYIDKEMGMLPPKLARIMVNLAGLNQGCTIWDPFCGSGTILNEALLLGYDVLGSDINRNAVFFSEKNIEWLVQNYALTKRKYKVFDFDITKPARDTWELLRHTQVDAIVCEPFMGPPQHRILKENKAKTLLEGVKDQYIGLLNVISRLDKRSMTLVLVVPSYKTTAGWATLSMNQIFNKEWICINKKLGKDLHWKRYNSIIKRKIFVFKHKNN